MVYQDNNRVIYFPPKKWPIKTAKLINSRIKSILKVNDVCSVMLTGGNSALDVYAAWCELGLIKKLRRINFYLSDERMVHKNHSHSNQSMIIKSLFREGVPLCCNFYPMVTDVQDAYECAINYEKMLPKSIDILILSVADDGHIASIFDDFDMFSNRKKLVTKALSNKHLFERVTITPKTIENAKEVFVLARGMTKYGIYKNLLVGSEDSQRLPAGLVVNGYWIFDVKLEKEITNERFSKK